MNIKFNFKKLLSLRGVALTLAFTSVFAMAGCGKKAECNIDGKHAHLYKNDTGYVRYIDKEYLTYEGYTRFDEYKSIEGEEDLYKFLDKKDLMRIDDNLDVIVSEQEKNKDYIEYRYKYTYLQPIPHIISTGKTTTTYFTYIPVTRHSWTSDPNHSRLTGETRVCHYVYEAFYAAKDENGKYVLISSGYVDDLRTVMDEYPLVKKKYYKVVNLDGKEVDYEDGKEEDLSDEDKKRQKEYEAENPEQTVSNNEEDKGRSLVKTK